MEIAREAAGLMLKRLEGGGDTGAYVTEKLNTEIIAGRSVRCVAGQEPGTPDGESRRDPADTDEWSI